MFISKGVIRSLSLTIKFPSETCGELPGALWGCLPLEGVASNEVQPAQAQPSPRLAKSLLKISNACYTIVVFS